jgi:imidazolonepropionase-like amidohydrolase
MSKNIRIALIIIAGCLMVGCGDSNKIKQEKSVAATDSKLLLKGVRIVDTHTGKISGSSDILIIGQKIISIGPSESFTETDSIKIINAYGKFIVPGFLDMHAHPMISRDITGSLALFLANGITGFRQMSGTDDLLNERRKGTLPIGADAPELLAMPGEVLNPLNANSPKEVVAEIDKQKREGADFIKVVAVSLVTFFAAQAEAKRVGLPFVGHLPEGVDVIKASKGGMKSIEHLGPGDGLLVACSDEEPDLEKAIAKIPPVKGPPFKIPFIKEITAGKQARIIINPLVPAIPENMDILEKAIDSYNDSKCQKLAKEFIIDGTWQVPTLIRLKAMQFGDAREFTDNPNLKYIPATTVKKWREVGGDFTKKMPASAKATYQKLYTLQLKLVKLFEETGVKMMAGDDFGGGWLVPGYSLHLEFDELQKAGLRPLTILQMTTLNGADFLGRSKDMGSVDKGKIADLVLLNANPLDDIQNLHKIFAVVRAGRYYSHDQLEELKSKVLATRAEELKK